MPAPGPILRAEHLRRVLPSGKVLLDGVTAEVQRGEVVAILGPSGSGKSTFLRLLNRLDEPTGGTVFLGGEDYRSLTPRDLRRRVGMVLQATSLFPGTVADNVSFGPRSRGDCVAANRIESLLEQVDLPGYAARDVHSLSGGEAQRVSLARTLINDPEVLLLDEPTSALDDVAERHVEQLICRIVQERHLTTLMVTHDRAQAERLANRAMLIERGRLARTGPVRDVAQSEPDEELQRAA